MEEKTIYFKMEMDVNEDYLRETWWDFYHWDGCGLPQANCPWDF